MWDIYRLKWYRKKQHCNKIMNSWCFSAHFEIRNIFLSQFVCWTRSFCFVFQVVISFRQCFTTKLLSFCCPNCAWKFWYKIHIAVVCSVVYHGSNACKASIMQYSDLFVFINETHECLRMSDSPYTFSLRGKFAFLNNFLCVQLMAF